MKILLISYFFPPSTGAASTLMYNLFRNIPKEEYWVITATGLSGLPVNSDQVEESRYGRYSIDSNATRLPPKSHGLVQRMVYVFKSVLNGFVLGINKHFDCILAVHPDETDLYAAIVLKFLLRVPLVVYMHDLFSEVRKRDRFYRIWRFLEEAVFDQASMIIVTNDIFKKYYNERGLNNVAVLPSCIDMKDNIPVFEKVALPNNSLRVVYTGSLYSANEDAISCFLSAVKKLNAIEVFFATSSKRHLEGVNTSFLTREKCLALQRSSDVLLLPLAFSSPYPEEIKIAFPYKTLEYLLAGRSILAIVPSESFAEQFVKKHGVGIVINTPSDEKVAEALEKLKIPSLRKRYEINSKRAINNYDAKVQAENLIALLNKAINKSNQR